MKKSDSQNSDYDDEEAMDRKDIEEAEQAERESNYIPGEKKSSYNQIDLQENTDHIPKTKGKTYIIKESFTNKPKTNFPKSRPNIFVIHKFSK